MSKEEKIARELMLPRHGKTKIIIQNSSDEESERDMKEKNENLIYAAHQKVAQTKRPKYIIKDENDQKNNATNLHQVRKNIMSNQSNMHGEPLKSVNHVMKNKHEMLRNKSVMGRGKISKNNSSIVNNAQIPSERSSFNKNQSVVINKKELKEISTPLLKNKEEIKVLPSRKYESLMNFGEEISQKLYNSAEIK